MDTLLDVHNKSISELRQILKDNDVKETSTNKDELVMQVTEVLLTELTIHEIMEGDVAPSDVAPSDVAPNDVAPSDGGAVTSPSTQDKTLISMQDVEYSEALRQDISRQELEKSMAFDELSPTSLRKKRLAYYQ